MKLRTLPDAGAEALAGGSERQGCGSSPGAACDPPDASRARSDVAEHARQIADLSVGSRRARLLVSGLSKAYQLHASVSCS